MLNPHETRPHRPIHAMLVAGLCGALLGLTFRPGFGHGPLVALAAAGWMHSLRRASCTRVVYLSVAFATGISILGANWVMPVMRTLGATSGEALLGFVLAGTYVVALPLLPLAALIAVSTRWPVCVRIGWIAASVYLIESGTPTIDGFVPWMMWSHGSLDSLGILQLAAIGGAPLVSSVLIGSGAALEGLLHSVRASRQMGVGFKRSDGVPAASALGVLFTLSLMGVGVADAARVRDPPRVDRALHVTGIQPDQSRRERLHPHRQRINLWRLIQMSRLVREDEAMGTRVIVWPENSVSLVLDEVDTALEALRTEALQLDTLFLIGALRETASREGIAIRSSALLLSATLTQWIDKTHAIPLLEARPQSQLTVGLASLFGAATAGARIDRVPSAHPLDDPRGLAPILCFEILFPSVVRARLPARARVIVLLVDDSWTSDVRARRQWARLTRLRAIENRLPVLRVAQSGGSGVVDELGRPRETLPLDGPGVIEFAPCPRRPAGLFEKASLLALAAAGAAVGRRLGTIGSTSAL